MSLLSRESQEYKYNFRLNEIAKIWRAGCIIRTALLGDIMEAYKANPDLTNLLVEDSSRSKVENRQEAWRYIVQTAVELGIPAFGLSTSLAYFDAYRGERLPANRTQAQRDYFGGHTYRRIDRSGSFHTEW
jgi:6-phosphogluconate dehydrogenase